MKVGEIELAGKKYPLCFSMGAYIAICESFGSMQEMERRLRGHSTSDDEEGAEDNVMILKTCNVMLKILMAEGRIYAAATGRDVPPPLLWEPISLIPAGSPTAMRAIFDTMRGDMDRTVEVAAKNGEATQGA